MTPPTASHRVKTLQFIWNAVTGSIGVYWIFGAMLIHPSTQTPPPIVSVIVLALGASTFATAWALYRRHIGAVEAQVTATALPRLSPTDRLLLVGRVQSGTIISLALLEAPAIYGLACGLARVTPVSLLTLLACVSLLACIAFRMTAFPTIGRLIETLEAPSPSAS